MTTFGPYLSHWGNRQVTSSAPAQARSESAIAINPQNVQNMVGASKKFIDPAAYHFKLGPVYTFDEGTYFGNVYVTWGAGSPLRFARSTDHGATWKGKGQDPPGSTIVSMSYAPNISISSDAFHHEGRCSMRSRRSPASGRGTRTPPITRRRSPTP